MTTSSTRWLRRWQPRLLNRGQLQRRFALEKLSLPNIDTTPVADAQVKMRQGLYHDLDAHESHIYGDGFHLDCTASC